MTENTRQVLEMLAAGRITTEEADRLIDALRETSTPAAAPSTVAAAAKPRYLRVIVDAVDEKDGPTKVNVRIPLQLLRAGVRLASLMPARAQDEINKALSKEGIDLDITKIKAENIDELIEELRDVSIDVAQTREDVKIRIFSE